MTPGDAQLINNLGLALSAMALIYNIAVWVMFGGK